ncbi:MAG: GNAT family N-acetyltransferase [Candidatus Brocadiae bacterium]|nr:GNAT family N-acetyltransferase [Candidatus Brocadiia bacterium]
MNIYSIIKIALLNDKDIEQWKDLWEKSNQSTFFNSYDWYHVCKEILKEDIVVFFIWKGKKLTAIAPLMKKNVYGIQCLTLFGEPYTDKITILSEQCEPTILKEILEELSKNNSIVLKELEETCINEWIEGHLYEIASENPYVNLKEDLKTQVKKKEWNLLVNKLKNQPFSFELYKREEAQKWISLLWEIEERSNKVERHRNLFRSLKAKELFLRIANSHMTVLAVLKYRGKPIAHMLGYNIKGIVFMAHHMAFDLEYKKMLPGKVLIVALLTHLQEKNFKIFDFSRGQTILKRHFSIYEKKNYNVYLPSNLVDKIWWNLVLEIKKKIKKYEKLIKLIYVKIKNMA